MILISEKEWSKDRNVETSLAELEAHLHFAQPGDPHYELAQQQLVRMEDSDNIRRIVMLERARERFEMACPGDPDFEFAESMIEKIDRTIEMVSRGEPVENYLYLVDTSSY